MLDHVLRDIAPGAVSLAFPDRHIFSGFERLKIVADPPYLPSTSLAYASSSMELAAVPQIIAHFIAHEKHRNYKYLKEWSEWQDSNLRPLRPERVVSLCTS